MFSACDCLPVSRRTPTASVITTTHSRALMAKPGEEKPPFTANAVQSAQTDAVWEDGIPPVPNSME